MISPFPLEFVEFWDTHFSRKMWRSWSLHESRFDKKREYLGDGGEIYILELMELVGWRLRIQE
ncbi:hypothetical protein QJS10_CPA08g00547 [Acorus calamus]|uniref:Uncharacterized protein n=1 Tax=Acorus calamus TaxID=4465 RepID=A0AAV9EDI5_ACOCL|nr:hypothetical protein QJS10_CPA08g00547 [Acorus calamus]